ncbi:cell division protein FtsQ/DivIB [Amycolatopsis pithecellobii]|uniref:FtsQ-type POTRA domain-containing protein n=1 Tax=Amycolatopsis pithecellobii TaxID=664692 RepID=A0A6N7ZBC6_9PSEU|nr:FtsQ-type POTRA domain-containing protein [Amycolatopsis pithecellobii]MTD59071.1 FtsQ-type POTRA domain-containing protein [Amycolatopsis pithecellobii]
MVTRQREQRRGPAPRRSTPARSRRGRRPVTARTRTGTGASRRRGVRRRWVALLSLLTVLTLGYLIFFTSMLGVRSVDVEGASTVPADQIRAAAGVPDRKPMMLVDTDEIADRVMQLPGVASVDVSRSWPSTVDITVTERAPIGFFTGPGGVHLVDGTGLDYKTVQNKPGKLPELDLAHVAPDDAVTRSVTAVLASLPQPLEDQVTAVRAQTPGGVEFTLANGKIVRWGSADAPDRKMKVLAVLMTRDGRIYDVASPELPTVS